MIALGYIFSLLYGAFCIALGELTNRMGLSRSYSRKVVHISVGFEWFILRYYMGTSWHFLVVCLAFLFLLCTARVKGWFSGMSSDGENAPGTVFYALSMSVMAGLTLLDPDFLMPFGIAVVCTSLGDGAAGVFGQLAKKGSVILHGNKTLFGTICCFAASFFGVIAFSRFFGLNLSVPMIYFIAFLSASAELASENGTDNLFLPLSVCFFAYGWLTAPVFVLRYLLPILLTPWAVIVADRKKILSKSGLAAALVLDAVMSATLGNVGFLLLSFFLGGGLLCDTVKKRAKRRVAVEEEKCGARDAFQVFANGGALALFSLIYALTDEPVFLFAGLTAIAEALGDTAGSGIGALSEKTFDLFRLRRCHPGESGGMTVVGTAASLVCCALSLGFSRLFFAFSAKTYFLMLGFAFLGTVVDSCLGSLCQAKYRCTVCGKMTEKRSHCDCPSVLLCGSRFVSNDVVNAVSTLFSGACALFLFIT